jgi:hypothetical protein
MYFAFLAEMDDISSQDIRVSYTACRCYYSATFLLDCCYAIAEHLLEVPVHQLSSEDAQSQANTDRSRPLDLAIYFDCKSSFV